MSNAGRRPLALVEVARLLFRTPHPNDQQIGRVFERMKAGALRVHERGRTPLDWTTTEESLAEFMANEMLKRQSARNRAPSAQRKDLSPSPTTAAAHRRAMVGQHARQQVSAANDMRGVYRGIWRDYFLAVMLRRRIAHRSVAFYRAVLAGQIVVLLSIVVLAFGLWKSIKLAPPERQAIVRFLVAQTDSFHVERWHPSRTTDDGTALLVEVEYRYTKESRRAIHTRRTFRVVGDEVSELSDE